MKKILLLFAAVAMCFASASATQVKMFGQKKAPITMKAQTISELNKSIQTSSIRKAPQHAQGVVTPGEGTTKPYALGCYVQGWYGMSWSSGLYTTITWSNDGKDVWFGNMFPYAFSYDGTCYIHGTVDGNTITVEKQYCYEGLYEEYGYSDVNVSCAAVDIDDDGIVTKVHDSFQMNIDENGNISMDNDTLIVVLGVLDADGNMTFDADGNQQVYDYSYGYEYSPIDEADITPVELPETAVPSAYLFKYTDAYDSSTSVLGQVAFDGQDMYVQGLSALMPEVWVKGTVSDDGKTLTIPSGQYEGLYYGQYMVALYGLTLTSDEDGTETFSVAENIVFTLGEDGVWTIAEGVYAGDVSVDLSGLYNYTYNVSMQAYAGDVADTPQNPSVALYDYYEYYGAYYLDAYFTNIGVNGNYLNTDNLYYRLYIDGEAADLAEIGYEDDAATLGGNDIPVSYNSDSFYGYGNSLEFAYYDDMWNTLGIQLVYKFNGEEYASDIVTVDIENNVEVIPAGISSIAMNSKSASSWYDLSGRRVAKNTKGIVIKNGQKVLLSK